MMRWLFKKNKEIRISPKYYLLLQDKWAKKMSALTSNLSKKCLVFYLILFVSSTASVSVYNLCNGLWGKEYKAAGTRISPDHLIVVKPALDIKKQTVLSRAEFENITHFSSYLESLKESKEGKKIYDSILYNRPGILDSLVGIENYYKTNFKK